MHLDPDSCYRALEAHDPRFDGKFFVAVSSTGIYCRPVCTARTPRRANCSFHASAAAAEAQGYRPCLRCRPELAPGNAGIDATARLAQAAVDLIENGVPDGDGMEGVAARIGVTGRHLRRIFAHEFGVTPVAYAQTQRLLLAKRLLTDTTLPVTEVALASGFASVRRFNTLWKARYRMLPSDLRRRVGAGDAGPARFAFELGYRPPYDWDAMLAFLRARAVAGVEHVGADRYRRTLAIEHRGARHVGWIDVRRLPRKSALEVALSASFARVVPVVLARVKHAFDLACDPTRVAAALGDLALARPGLRRSSRPMAPSRSASKVPLRCPSPPSIGRLRAGPVRRSCRRSRSPARGRCSGGWRRRWARTPTRVPGPRSRACSRRRRASRSASRRHWRASV